MESVWTLRRIWRGDQNCPELRAGGDAPTCRAGRAQPT
jgi:hypothetical protein